MPDTIHFDDAVLNEYLDDMLEPAQRAAVEAHLAGCMECEARLADIRSVFLALETLPDMPVQRDLSADVLAAISHRSAWRAVLEVPLVFKLLFALQIPSLLALFLVTWPRLTMGVPEMVVVRASDLLVSAASLLDAWSVGWQALGEMLSSWLKQGLEIGNQLASHPVSLPGSMSELFILLVAVSLAWLLANRLLLRQRKLDHHSDTMKRRM